MPTPRHRRRRDVPSTKLGMFEILFSAVVIAIALPMWAWQSMPLASVGVGVVGLFIGALDVYNSHKGKDEPHDNTV